jgi:hypothetical protein
MRSLQQLLRRSTKCVIQIHEAVFARVLTDLRRKSATWIDRQPPCEVGG